MNQVFKDIYETVWKEVFNGTKQIPMEKFVELFTTDIDLPKKYTCQKTGKDVFMSERYGYPRYIHEDEIKDFVGEIGEVKDFNELLKRFPDSKYSEDARLRMLYLRNSLAQYEVNVARFYMVRGAYVAAANRAKKVVESYQRTPAVPEALVVMAKAYKVLGMNDLSADALRVLKLNFPDNAGIAEVETVVVNP